MYYQMETPAEIFETPTTEIQQNLNFIREKLRAKAKKTESKKELEISSSELPIKRDVILLDTLKILRERKWEVLFRNSKKEKPEILLETLDQILTKNWVIRPKTK